MDTSNRNTPGAKKAAEEHSVTEGSIPKDEKIVLGKVASPFGVRGWTKVTSYTEPTEGLLDYKVWEINQNGRKSRLTVQEGRVHGKFLAVKFNGIDDRDNVAKLTNSLVELSRQDLPEPKDGSYYWADLIGLSVRTVDGVELGIVEKIMETGANDVLVVAGDKERLVPWIQGEVIKAVDLEEKLLTVDWDPDF